jgi:hypothetical protein
MSFKPLVFKTDEDLSVITNTVGQEVIQTRGIDGKMSPYGCGWNVLLLLKIVSRVEAQAGVDEIVFAHSRHGVDSHAGLLIGDHTNPKSISAIIGIRRGIQGLSVNRFRFDEFGNDPEAIQAEIIKRFFPSSFEMGINYYIIIKYIRDWETGLGHTVLLSFKPKEGGAEVSVLDPQLKRENGFGETATYLLATKWFIGIACCGIVMAGGKSRKLKRKTNRKSRKHKQGRKQKGGELSNDPEMYPMTVEQDEEYQTMIDILKKQPMSEPSIYHSIKSSTNPLFISL